MAQYARTGIGREALRLLLLKVLKEKPARFLGTTRSTYREVLLKAKTVCFARLTTHNSNDSIPHPATRCHVARSRRPPNMESAI
jgi:hypothetical protein